MPDGSIPLLLILIVLVILSAFFSATETAFSCASKIKLRAQSTNGDTKAKKVLDLVENKFDKLISTVLVGNNIVNITAATVATALFSLFIKNGGLSPSVLSTIVTTVAILIFGETIPKLFAKSYPEKFSKSFYPLIMFFSYVLYPINIFFTGLKFVLNKIFKLSPEDVVTEDEILTVVEEAEEDGTLKEEETKLIRSVIEFDDLEVGDIFVPRVNMVAVDINTPLEDIKKIFEKEGYSRLPVYKDTIDTIIGTIHEKDFFSAYLKNKHSIDGILQNALYTTEHIKISNLLKLLQKNKVHMAVVLDEYGGTLGLVTLEDILEELVGEIWDEHDEEVNFFKQVADNTCIVDGKATILDVFEYFSQDFTETEQTYDATTLSGFIIEYLGEIPRVGKKFTYGNFEFEVLKSTIKRVLSVKITLTEITEE